MHEAKVIMNLTNLDHEAKEGDRSYVYSSRVDWVM
jgi:hypothetical protein